MYLKYLCTDVQALAQTVLDALNKDPAIVLAHGAPLVNLEDTARVRVLVESLVSKSSSLH